MSWYMGGYNVLVYGRIYYPWLLDCPQNFTVALDASLLGQPFIFRTIFQPRTLYPPIYQSPERVYLLKVLLHCAIFSATCLATPIATQVAGELHSVTGVVS